MERIVGLKDTTIPAPISAEYLPIEKHTDWLWPIWVHNMRQAIKENAIPWKHAKIQLR
jgi:hypothetical protein